MPDVISGVIIALDVSILLCFAMAKIGYYFEICKKKEKNLQETEQKCGKSGKFGWFIRKKIAQ